MIPDKENKKEDLLTEDNNFGTAGTETDAEYRKPRNDHAVKTNEYGIAENEEWHSPRDAGHPVIHSSGESPTTGDLESYPGNQPAKDQITHSDNVGGTPASASD
ncbi:hypothetical protein FW774_08925 [Pedobacter sp. BS3]|uniref:hypothetical protein n=1 Tax=Pedobacter sp. BS3 TaxID=2567937 RepID=UPI0011EF6472|nr:hypothetical protein [Pedobacter sp. BS3]TZF83592.1 hypothetical protein FW774_08925 [Pedobacter sp. BS3]